jgi:hypothetical protein
LINFGHKLKKIQLKASKTCVKRVFEKYSDFLMMVNGFPLYLQPLRREVLYKVEKFQVEKPNKLNLSGERPAKKAEFISTT